MHLANSGVNILLFSALKKYREGTQVITVMDNNEKMLT